MSLGSHSNVWSTCLELLERRGYHLEMEYNEVGDPDQERRYDTQSSFSAERDGFRFCAENPIELLGLTAIYEDVRPTEHSPYWWSANTHGTDVMRRLAAEAEAREAARHGALEELRARDPAAWEERVRSAFEEGWDRLNAATFLGVARSELDRILEAPQLADLRARPRNP